METVNGSLTKISPIVLITIGDPGSSGPELAVRAAFSAEVRKNCVPVLIGSPYVIRDAIRRTEIPADLRLAHNFDRSQTASTAAEEIRVFPHGDLKPKDYVKGKPSDKCGEHAVEVSRQAAKIAMCKEVDAICSSPTSKVSLELAGYNLGGMSEIFRMESRADYYRSMLVLDEYRLLVATSHVALRRVPDLISRDLLIQLVTDFKEGLTTLLGISNPRIGVAGLNPHCGENGLYGTEELDVIIPAIKAASQLGMDVVGPIPADFLVAQYRSLQLDGAVAMYHDQANIALKALGLYRAATLLLGLPIIRTSVAHGTVYGKAKTGTADPSGMIHAVSLAASLAVNSSRVGEKY